MSGLRLLVAGLCMLLVASCRSGIQDVENSAAEERSAAVMTYNVGAGHMYAGKYEEAAACFERALAKDPALSDAHYYLAVIYQFHLPEASGAAEKAAEHLDRFSKAGGDRARIDAFNAAVRFGLPK